MAVFRDEIWRTSFKGLAQKPTPSRHDCILNDEREMKYKLRFRSEQEAAECALYLDDRGYSVKLMGKALVVDKPDQADLALVMATYRAWVDEKVSEFDLA